MQNTQKTVFDSPEIYADALKRCTRIIKLLNLTSEYIGESYSPSILLTGLGGFRSYLPFMGDYWWHSGNDSYQGYISMGVAHVNPNFTQFGELRKQARTLHDRHKTGNVGDTDKAFEIINYFSNTWWGERDYTPYPNQIAKDFLTLVLNEDQSPLPFGD